MLASEEKLAENNLVTVLGTLKALELLREQGGYGTIELKVQDGKAIYARIIHNWQLEEKFAGKKIVLDT
jgi:hypothetical protein